MNDTRMGRRLEKVWLLPLAFSVLQSPRELLESKTRRARGLSWSESAELED